MNNKVVQFPPQRAARPREIPALPASIEALKAATVPLILEQLQRMFEQADDALFEMSERPGTDRDRRVFFDAMRHLRLHRVRMSEAFHAALIDGFSAADTGSSGTDAAEAGELRLQSDQVLEENLAQAHVVTRAENLYQTMLWELDRRLAQQPPSVSPRALSPQHICDAFRACHAGIELDLRVRLILYKLFERAAIIGLGAVYALALEVLDTHGAMASAVQGRRAEKTSTEAHQAPTGTIAPASPVLDPLTLEALQALLRAGSGAASAPAVAHAALPDLVQLSRGHAPAQRLSLAGQLFNDVFADTYAPEQLRETFDRFRQPLARIALGDARFFSDPQHPVRTLLDEAASVVATARTADRERGEQLAARLRQIAADIEGRGRAAEPDLQAGDALGLSEVAAFLEHQRAQARERRAQTIQRARQSVAEEMESRLRGRSIPAAASPFLQSALAPVMGLRLLRHGKTSQAWTSSLDSLATLIDLLDFDTDREQSPVTDRAAFLEHIRAELLAAGMSPARTDEAIASLRRAFEERDAESPEAPRLKAETWVAAAAAAQASSPRPGAEAAPAPSGVSNGRRATAEEMALLETLVRVDRYFSVYDPGRAYTRWLRVWGFYRAPQYIAFASFDERPVLSLAAGRFIDDLAAQRTTPCDAGAVETAAVSALAALRVPPPD